MRLHPKVLEDVMIPKPVLQKLLAELRRNEMTRNDALDVLDRFVGRYRPDEPCRYDLSCLRSGRCPHDPVCNN